MSDQSVADQGDDASDGEDTKTTPDNQGQPQLQPRQQPPGMGGQLGALVQRALAMGQGRPVGPLNQPRIAAPFDQLQQRFMAREAPYARPTGPFPPYREGQVQTYVPALPIRSPDQWGEPGRFPNTPQTWELPGMWNGIGQKLSQIGSGNVAQLAGRLGMGTDMKSYLAGQSAALKIQHERKVDAAWEIDRRLQEELRDARDMFTVAGGDVTTWTGENAAKLMAGARQLVAKYNDPYLQAAIDSGDFRRVEGVLKERDALSQDLRASLAQQQRDADKRRFEQPFRIDGGPSQAGPPMGHKELPAGAPTGALPTDNSPDPYQESPDGQPPAAAAPKPEEAAPGDDTGSNPNNDISPYGPGATTPQAQAARAQRPGGVQVAQAGANDAPQPGMAQLAQAQPAARPQWQTPPSQVDPEAQAAGWRPDMIDAAAVQAINDPRFKPNAKGAFPGYPGDETGYIMRRRDEIATELRRIANSNLSGADAESAIRAVNPQLADGLKQYVQGNLPVPQTAQFAGLASEYILPLGKKLDPTFNEFNYKLRYQTKKDFTSGTEGRTLTSIATAKLHLEHALGAMDNVPDYLTSQFGNWRTLGGLFDDQTKAQMGILDNAIHTGSNEYERALLGGKPSRGSITDTEKELDWRHRDPEYIKGLLRDKITALKARLDKLHDQFRAGFGRGPDDMDKIFDNWAGSGKDKIDSSDPERTLAAPGQIQGLKDLDKWDPRMGGGVTPSPRPPPSPQDNDALNWARQNPNDPRAKRILQHLGQ